MKNATSPRSKISPLERALRGFREFGKPTVCGEFCPSGRLAPISVYVNEFWTSKQRAAHRLHEISYRACFKPQLPRFFIERLTRRGDVVYDPFMGRGTTLLEAAFLGRVPWGNDINPLSGALVSPRLAPPRVESVAERLGEIEFGWEGGLPEELLVFYHPDTLREICALKMWLAAREKSGKLDGVDAWIRMVALNRLTGHSPGFFSVYTMPPNQAVSIQSQKKINAARKQTPPRREVPKLILLKSKDLLRDCDGRQRRALATLAERARLFVGPADRTPEIPDGSVQLVVTSPPFLDVVDYATDNWLRCWFRGIDASKIKLTTPKSPGDWRDAMAAVFRELARALAPGGHIAFEVGEVNKGKLKLEEIVIPCGEAAGLEPLLIMINDQKFTKTANCWGVENNAKGTNTNRIAVFRKA